VRQADYPVVHLTDSVTLTAHIYWQSTRRFRNFLAPYELKGAVTILPSTAVSRTPVISISRPAAPTPSSRYCSSDLYFQTILHGNLDPLCDAHMETGSSVPPNLAQQQQLQAHHSLCNDTAFQAFLLILKPTPDRRPASKTL
jgi:hypothetical protein